MNYSTDKPIDTCEQDLLGRASFSKQLGRAIYDYNGKDGLVIGLYGKWGSGKTSVINMAVNEMITLAEQENNMPLVMKFAPWNYSDKDNLISIFFQSLKNKIELQDNEELKKEALVYGEEYYDILCVAYRESIAAHKLIEVDGEIRFFSKECYSNGCIGTVDVTYPSIPLYLKYQPKLVEGMIDPIFHYAAGDDWKFPYAPHDVGQYPLANGQVYGYDRKTRVMQDYYQMPVEECGNMILCVAALCKAENSLKYAKKHKEVLNGWTDYLVSVGWDPENQLCTDDFAGHLAHNCNLAVKGILGIAAWAELLRGLGETEKADSYRKTALSLAETWKEKAFDGDHYRLTFDGEGSWSLKYNLIWDKLLDLRIFDPKIAKTEVAYYLTRMNPYGIPLDSRCDYTKSDWEMWTAVLDDNEEYRKQIIHTMWKALCSLDRRAPFPDWYHTETPKAEGFQNRTVQGGLFILLLNW